MMKFLRSLLLKPAELRLLESMKTLEGETKPKQRIIEVGLEAEFPSLEVAFPIALASFDNSQKRLDAVDSKNQSLSVFCFTSFIAFPTIGRALNVPFDAVFFYAALLLMGASMLIAIFSLRTGTVDTVSAEDLFIDWLDRPIPQFQKNMIYFAGESQERALALIEQKWSLHTLSLILYFAAIIAASVWMATA